MLDAGNNRYFMGEDNIPLSPLEIREELANNDIIKCNVEDDNYKYYMAKNMFYFKALQNNTFGSDLQNNQKIIYCVPKGFNVLEREIAYCEYAIKNSPAHLVDDWKNALAEFKNRTYFINVDATIFFA